MHTAPNPAPAASPEKSPSQPMFHVLPVTLFLVLAIVGIHLTRVFYLSEAQDMVWVMRLGFIPLHLREYAFASIWPWLSLVSYAGLHFGWTHLIVNATGILAFGTAIERAFGWKRYLLVLLIGIVVGALTHFIFFSDSSVLLGGISAGLSALFAIMIGLMQQRNGWRGVLIPSLVWIVLNIVVGFIGIPGQLGLAIAWIAHLGGFIAGLICLPFLVPSYRISLPKKAVS